jgi:RimJ/RimL family protein N-acetyltransferase
MFQITPSQTATLKDWFLPEQPGPLIGPHLIQSGNGACFVDRWPAPRAVLVDTAGNSSLRGDPAALEPGDLASRLAAFFEAPDPFVPLLKQAFPDLIRWERVILELPGPPRLPATRPALIRRLTATDGYHLWGLSPESAWICKTWGGPAGLAGSGYGWGAFVAGRLVSVACTFFVGEHYEDVGVVTEPGFRGQGLSLACAGSLCLDIQARGRRASWGTSPDNTASYRVAEKLGFQLRRHDFLYVAGHSLPAPAKPDSA